MLHDELNKDNVNKLVVLFYKQTLGNEKLAPYFIEKLGDDLSNETWQKHIELLTKFWLTLLTGKGDYKGAPFPPHLEISNLDQEAFETWIKLFFSSVDKLYVEKIALKFKEKSSIIASNFMRNLGI
jgi:hemoglobin